MSSSEMMPALLLTQTGSPLDFFKRGEIGKPKAGHGELLARIKCTALNPVDWKMAQYGFAIEAPLPLVLGCDMAGVVEEVGDGMEGVKPGDEIFSFTGVGKPGRGTFATHCIVKDKLFFRKPSHLTLEQAASLPLGLLTAARALFDVLRLNAPTAAAEGRERDEFVLVWGGSGNVGSMAVQLLSLAGYRVVATCSEHNTDYVKSLGAEYVVDYKRSNCLQQIARITEGKLRYAFDTIGADTAGSCASLLAGRDGAHLACCAGVPSDVPAGVKVDMVMLADKHSSAEGIRILRNLFQKLQPIIDSGKLQPNPVQKLDAGYEGILAGLRKLYEGDVSGQKFVVDID